MRSTVTFHHPAELLALSEEDGILGVEGAGWFLDLLRTIPGVELSGQPVQEDWGVVVAARREGRSYRLGLGSTGEQEWIARVRPESSAVLERLSPGGRAARAALVVELDRALRAAKATGLRWFDEGDRNLRDPADLPG